MLIPGNRLLLPALKVFLVVPLLLNIGCVCCDGAFTYHVEGALVDKGGNAVPNVAVAVLHYRYHSDSPQPDEFEQIAKPGRLVTDARSNLDWGFCFLYPFRPPVPKPPKPERLHLWFRYPNGSVTSQEVIVDERNVVRRSPGVMWIDLGRIVLPGVTSAPY